MRRVFPRKRGRIDPFDHRWNRKLAETPKKRTTPYENLQEREDSQLAWLVAPRPQRADSNDSTTAGIGIKNCTRPLARAPCHSKWKVQETFNNGAREFNFFTGAELRKPDAKHSQRKPDAKHSQLRRGRREPREIQYVYWGARDYAMTTSTINFRSWERCENTIND